MSASRCIAGRIGTVGMPARLHQSSNSSAEMGKRGALIFGDNATALVALSLRIPFRLLLRNAVRATWRRSRFGVDPCRRVVIEKVLSREKIRICCGHGRARNFDP